jgi:hypothetical protein
LVLRECQEKIAAYLTQLAEDQAKQDHSTPRQLFQTWYDDITSSDFNLVWKLFHTCGPDPEQTEPFNSRLVDIGVETIFFTERPETAGFCIADIICTFTPVWARNIKSWWWCDYDRDILSILRIKVCKTFSSLFLLLLCKMQTEQALANLLDHTERPLTNDPYTYTAVKYPDMSTEKTLGTIDQAVVALHHQ